MVAAGLAKAYGTLSQYEKFPRLATPRINSLNSFNEFKSVIVRQINCVFLQAIVLGGCRQRANSGG